MPLIIKIVFAVMLLSAAAILIMASRATDYDPRWDEYREESDDRY